jgi:hypothetical protein
VRALRAGLERPSLSAIWAAANLPGWLAELSEGVDEPVLLGLERAQILVICAGLLQDEVCDAPRGAVTAWDAIPILAEAQRVLGQLLPLEDPFWSQWARLLHEQAESARWERRRGRAKFGASLARALGRKAALARMPALAIPRLARGAPQDGSLDRIAQRLFVAHQLLDDVLDVDEDAKLGQPNAVLAALMPSRAADVVRAEGRLARAIQRVCRHARTELAKIRLAIPAENGLARHCARLADSAGALVERAHRLAWLRSIDGICATLVNSEPAQNVPMVPSKNTRSKN